MQRRRGFSLTELLVVIAIIVALMGMLMPALAKARSQANRTRCQSNLRQVLIACTTYENEWNFSCPWANWHGPEVAGYRPAGWLYQYPAGATATAKPGDVVTGALYVSLCGTDVYHCPDDSTVPAANPTQRLTSYLMNGATCGYGKVLNGYKVTSFQSDAIMLWEADPSGPAWNAGGVYPSQGISTRHNGGGMIGCFDGHAEWFSANDFATEVKNLPGRLWCNPGSKGGA